MASDQTPPMPMFPPPENPNDPGRGPMILGITWTLTSLCIIVIGLRFYIRIHVLRALSSDDWFMLAAGILQIAFQACVTRAYQWGIGKHDKDLTFDPQLISILKWNWISTTPAILVSITARISAAILLVRIFGARKWFKWFLIIFTTLQTMAASLVIIFVWAQCSPVEGLWQVLRPARRWDPRIQQYSAYVGQSLFTFSDLTYVLFPVIFIFKLKMPLGHKIGLTLAMAASLFTMAMSIMKTLTSQSSSSTDDVQYKDSLAVLWSAFEQSFVIMMSCIPSLRPISKVISSAGQAVGSSLRSFLRRGSSQGSQSSYRDIELASSKQSNGSERDVDSTTKVSAQGMRGTESFENNAQGTIRRTDQYSVSYDR